MQLDQWSSFLNLIGITNDDGDFLSSRDGFEVNADWTLMLALRYHFMYAYIHKLQVYKLRHTGSVLEYHIFDGNLQMRFNGEKIEEWMCMTAWDNEYEYDEEYWLFAEYYPVIFRRHSTKESLEKAKNREGFEKLDVFFSPN